MRMALNGPVPYLWYPVLLLEHQPPLLEVLFLFFHFYSPVLNTEVLTIHSLIVMQCIYINDYKLIPLMNHVAQTHLL